MSFLPFFLIVEYLRTRRFWMLCCNICFHSPSLCVLVTLHFTFDSLHPLHSQHSPRLPLILRIFGLSSFKSPSGFFFHFRISVLFFSCFLYFFSFAPLLPPPFFTPVPVQIQ